MGIDVGATFTKLAVRRALDVREVDRACVVTVSSEPAALTGLVQEDRCYPSVVANDNGRWLFGLDAYRVRPGPGVTIHGNWKRALLRGESEGMQIAAGFARRLLLHASDEMPDGAITFRVAIPRLDAACANAHNVRRAFMLGFEKAVGAARIERVDLCFEPVANFLGINSEGRNAVALAARKPPVMQLGHMLHGLSERRDHPLFEFLARLAREGVHHRGDTLRFATIDFGSYTVDAAVLDYRIGPGEDVLNVNPTEVRAASWECGVTDGLVRRVRPQIERQHRGLHWDALPALEQAAIVRVLFEDSGRTLAVAGVEGIGNSADRDAARTAMGEYCAEVATLVGNWLGDPMALRAFSTTGGGSLIPGLSKTFGECLYRTDWETCWVRRKNVAPEFVRSATAHGAASIGVPSIEDAGALPS